MTLYHFTHTFADEVSGSCLLAGPVLSGRADGVSKETVTAILEGKGGSIMPWVVDVRDIGRAHVLGIEVCIVC